MRKQFNRIGARSLELSYLHVSDRVVEKALYAEWYASD